jgi:hypothetical protein
LPVGQIPPWAQGPAEVFRHADDHYRRPDDTDRRLALIGFDNAIEVCVDTFVGLNPRNRGGYQISRNERPTILWSFHSKVEFLERYAAEKGISLSEGLIDAVVWYHDLRNELYHSGNGMTPERRHLVDAREAARTVFRALFNCEVAASDGPPPTDQAAPEPPPDSGANLVFLSTYINFERAVSSWFKGSKSGYLPQQWSRYRDASPWAVQYDALVQEARGIRNEIAHGQVRPGTSLSDERLDDIASRLADLAELVSARPPAAPTQPKRGLRGRRLAEAAHGLAVDEDQSRSGLSTLAIVDLLVRRGTAIDGDEPAKTVFQALGQATDLFERGEGGRFIWMVPNPVATTQRPIKEATSDRERDLVAFWERALPPLIEAIPIFGTVRPRPYPFVTKSIGGTTYRVNVKLDDTSMWVMVRGRTGAETAARFERLRGAEAAVREAIDTRVGFVGPENATQPFVGAKLSRRGIRDRDAWDEVVRETVTNASRLYEAVQPFV